jgi:hypothetical protein
MGVYLYAGDLFKPLNLLWDELMELARNPAALLERLRPEVEGLLGCRVAELKPFKAMVGESGSVAEYIAVLEASGEASVKLIYAEDPVEALREYYEWEWTGRR